jgi:hypothetical protein
VFAGVGLENAHRKSYSQCWRLDADVMQAVGVIGDLKCCSAYCAGGTAAYVSWRVAQQFTVYCRQHNLLLLLLLRRQRRRRL